MRRARLVACACAIALAGSFGCSKGGDAAPAAPSETTAARVPLTVRFDPAALERLGIAVEPAGAADGEARLQLPGTLEYDLERYAEVGTLVDGRVASVGVRVGDRVKKGERLATLLVPSLANAQADYLSALSAREAAREHVRREESLLAHELTTAREAEVARDGAQRAEAELAAATARLQVLGAAVPTSGSAIAANGTLTLVSPLDGVVVRRDAVTGKLLRPETTAFVVADTRSLWATLDVYEADAPYFAIGTEADIRVDAVPGRSFRGRVSLLEPQVGRASRTMRARIAVDNADGALRPGFFVRASVPLPDARGGAGLLRLPAAAVQPLGEADVVFVERAPGSFDVRAVKVARRTPQVVEVTEGVSAGERVAVRGAFLLRGEVTKP